MASAHTARHCSIKTTRGWLQPPGGDVRVSLNDGLGAVAIWIAGITAFGWWFLKDGSLWPTG